MRQNETCCWLITVDKSIVKRTVASIADRTGAIPSGAAPGRTKPRNTGPCRCGLLAAIKLPRTAIWLTKKEALNVPGSQLSSPQRGQHRKTPGQHKKAPSQHKKAPSQRKNISGLTLRHAVQIRAAATMQRQSSVLHKKAHTRPTASETGQTAVGKLAAAGTKSSDPVKRPFLLD